VRLVEWTIDHEDTHGIYNGTSTHPVQNTEFTKTLARVLHRPALASVPALALHIALGEMADSLLLTGQRVNPARAIEGGFTFGDEALEPALRQLLVT